MIPSKELIAESRRRLNFDPEKLDQRLGDGPLELSPNEKARRFRQQLAATEGAPETARVALERIITGNDLVSINYLAKGVAAARPVCRIQLRRPSGEVEGFGSGFLIGPGVLMTNHHVFGVAADARHALADFDYELDVAGVARPPVSFGFDPARLFYANKELDFALVAVQPRSVKGNRGLSDWGWLKLDGTPGKSNLGEYLTIIQHPAGERKQVCVRENKLLKFEDDILWYMTDTLGGSSGSPVFNRFWQVVALHHSGVPKTNKQGQWLTRDGRVWDESMDETLVDWIANEGIRVSSIVKHLQEKLGSHPLVKPLLQTDPPAPKEMASVPAAADPTRGFWVEQHGDTASLVVPVRIPVDLVRQEVAPVTLPTPEAVDPAVPALPETGDPVLLEAVNINQTTLGSRPGYRPDFLGKGALSVPMPVIPPSLSSQVATFKEKPAESVLKYFNYSVVMNKQRRLAFFSAVNIDGKLRKDTGKREGDTWLTDPRIKREFQLDNDFYGKQTTFEAGRDQNPFDRGHLVRRLDSTWGRTEAEAKEHGDDTFHFTNCAPQFHRFNQGSKLWLGLEEFVLDQLEEAGQKACVINGPVFDGPLAGRSGAPDPNGARRKDPVFGGVPIPKFFWKIMVLERNGKLGVTAFLLSQQQQILGIDRIHEAAILEKLTAAEARVFQVSVSDLTKLTKLNFGKLAQASANEASVRGGLRELRSHEDIRL